MALKPFVLWFTGLSGSGKSTICEALKKSMTEDGNFLVSLDGDDLRDGLCSDLGFTSEDRDENNRRAREVASMMYCSGLSVVCTFISPTEQQRTDARELIGVDFIEVYMNVDLGVCRKRDPKGLYKKVDNGEIKNFTGIDMPYDIPVDPNIVLGDGEVSDSVNTIIEYLTENGYLGV